MCPECGRLLSEGHAAGCRNGPQMAPINVPFGRTPDGTRVGRNRYERVQRFPGPDGNVVENPQSSADGFTWVNETWEAMQSVRGMTASEMERRADALRRAREDAGVYGIGIAEMTASQVAAIQAEMAARINENIMRVMNPHIVMPTEGWSESLEPGSVVRLRGVRLSQRAESDWQESPRTSADGPSAYRSQSHTIENLDGGLPGGIVYRCSCGWQVDRAWLVGVADRDVRGMLEAHCAGGQVGPQQAQFREGGKPFEYTRVAKKMFWETPEISEPAFMPRRTIILEE